jgi:hypothetical protein
MRPTITQAIGPLDLFLIAANIILSIKIVEDNCHQLKKLSQFKIETPFEQRIFSLINNLLIFRRILYILISL